MGGLRGLGGLGGLGGFGGLGGLAGLGRKFAHTGWNYGDVGLWSPGLGQGSPAMCHCCHCRKLRGFPNIRGTFLGVPIIRPIVFWGLYWGTSI